MSEFPSSKAPRVLAALLRIGWAIKRQRGSHRLLVREGWPDLTFAWHDGVELGPGAMKRLARVSGLSPTDL